MSARFGFGKYYRTDLDDGVENDATAHARDYFLAIAANEIPELVPPFRLAVESPAREGVPGSFAPGLPDVLWGPLREKAGPALFTVTKHVLGLERRDDLNDLDRHGPMVGLAPVRAAVEAWARRFHLEDNVWAAVRLLLRAYISWELREGIYEPGMTPDPDLAALPWIEVQHAIRLGLEEVNAIVPWAPRPGPEPQNMTLSGWDSTAETWADYRTRTEAAFAAWMKRQATWAEQDPTLAPTPVSYTPEHYRWLARWQLLGESHNDIASRLNGVGRETVARQCRRTAKVVALRRRTG